MRTPTSLEPPVGMGRDATRTDAQNVRVSK
jgi:hypothetical protein